MSNIQQHISAPSVREVTARRCKMLVSRNAYPVARGSSCSCGHDHGGPTTLSKGAEEPVNESKGQGAGQVTVHPSLKALGGSNKPWKPALASLRIRFEKSLRLDPGNVLTTQRAFERELVRRFNEIKTKVRQLVVEEDCFGLKPVPHTLGGTGSGNFGHTGRPGEVGGSGEGAFQEKMMQKTFTPPPRSKNSGDVMVRVDVKVFDAAFAKDTDFYLDNKGSNRIGKRYEQFAKFFDENSQIEMPEVNVDSEGRVSFINGRHRYAYMRDQGATTIPVSVVKEGVENAKKFGLVRGESIYHGTYSAVVSQIKKEGLKPGIGDKVFHSTKLNEALDWGRIRAEKNYDDTIIIVEVDADAVKASKVSYGEDSFRVADKVAPNQIRSISAYSVKDVDEWLYGSGKRPKPKTLSSTYFVVLTHRATQPKVNTRFAFSTSANKVQSFMSWLEDQNDQGILGLTLVGDRRYHSGRKAWENLYIDSAYKKGMVFSDKQLKKKGLRPSSLAPKAVYPVDSFFNAPLHADRVGLIYTRTYSALKGITDAMDAKISTTLAQGIADGKSPLELARDMSEDIDGIGIRRAKLIARTEIMRAHNVASVNVYREAGVLNVAVQAEWSTAGDERVCPDCESLEGKVFTLDQIENLLPLHPNCIVDGQTPVMTRKGWIPIQNVKVGDSVLTHRGRFRKVTKTHKTLVDSGTKCVRFGTTRYDGNWKAISVTSNHPVYAERGWVEAGDLTLQDKVYLLASKCKGCGGDVPWNVTWCCKSCSSRHVAKEQWKDPAMRQAVSTKVRESMLQQYASGKRDSAPSLRKAHATCRQMFDQGVHPLTSPENRRKANKVLAETHLSGTWLERRLGWAMRQLGLSPTRGHAVRTLVKDALGRYRDRFPDFAFLESKLAVEADGEAWHSKEYDAKRDVELHAVGWTVLHFTEHQIDTDLMGCALEVQRVLLNHTHQYHWVKMPISQLRKWKLAKSRSVFNLTVEGDESYHVWGWVVHNCRCIALPLLTNEEGQSIDKGEEV